MCLMEPTTIGVSSSTLCWERIIAFLTDLEILVLVGDHLDYISIYDNIHTFIPANYEGIQGRWSILPALCGSTPFSTTSPGCTSSVSSYWS